jgi:hypothetical protein
VFLGPDGKRIDPDYFDEFVFGRISAHPGLSNIRFHDLRDFFASMFKAKARSMFCHQMGHSRIQDHLPHVWPTSFRTCVKQQQRSCNRRCSQEGTTVR